MSRSSSSLQSSPMRPMMRPLPPSAVARGTRASGARLTEQPTRMRQRARRQRVQRYVLRTVAAVVLALTASLFTARPAHDVDAAGARPAASRGPATTHTVGVVP